MKNFLYQIYNKLPNGYLRSLIKNILSFIMARKSEIEMVSLGKIKYPVYVNPLVSNKRIMQDIKGYFLNYRLNKGDVAVDAGAYNGLFTVYAAIKVGPRGRVIALEPDPYSLHMLNNNIKLNHLTNVILVKKGLFSRKARMKFDVQGVGSRLQIYNRDIPTINSIDVDSLDNLVRDLKINKVNFVKMDIEGAEIEALKGCKQTILHNSNIHFAIASYHIVDGKKTSYGLEKIFKSFKLKSVTKNTFHLTTFSDKS